MGAHIKGEKGQNESMLTHEKDKMRTYPKEKTK